MATGLDLRKREIIEIGASSAVRSENLSGLRLAWHRSRDTSCRELVLVEPKDYGNNPDDDTGNIVYERIKDLAQFLHALEPATDGDSGKPRTLKCKGWYEDQLTSQFCFVYHLPQECANPTGELEFITLYEAYSTSKPAVGARIRLAHVLAETLLSIHQNNWVHKGIRSDRVLFFPPKPGARPSLDCPRLVGFDYARRDGPNEYSEKPIEKHANLYRHPSTLRDPTTTFRRIHDYYSFGILMVEIACWKPLAKVLVQASELDGTECKEDDIRRVREILKQYGSPGSGVDIAFRMGSIYRKAVDVCLDGSFDAHDGQPLLDSFRRQVINELGSCRI